MASQWDSLLPDIIKIGFDKILLSGMLGFATFWLQKKLELFRRNQTLTSEVAKARLVAYHRVFKNLAGAIFTANSIWALIELAKKETNKDQIPLHWQAVDAKITQLGDNISAFQVGLSEDEFLLNESFVTAAWECCNALCESLVESTAAAHSRGPSHPDGRQRHMNTFAKHRNALLLCLPQFVRTPAKDLHFKDPVPPALLMPVAQNGKAGTHT